MTENSNPTKNCPGCGRSIQLLEPETKENWGQPSQWCSPCGGTAPFTEGRNLRTNTDNAAGTVEIWDGDTLLGTVQITRDATQRDGMRVVEMVARGRYVEAIEPGARYPHSTVLMSSIASGGTVNETVEQTERVTEPRCSICRRPVVQRPPVGDAPARWVHIDDDMDHPVEGVR